MAAWLTYLEYLTYFVLLFFVIPIRIKHLELGDGEIKFQEYLKTFNKTYPDPEIYQMRLRLFENSLRAIETLNLNQTNHSAIYGLTKFSDLDPEEFLSNHLLKDLHKRIEERKMSVNHTVHHYSAPQRNKREITSLPEKVDWRLKHVVSDIKSQGNCGACWAFSAVETIESMNAIKTGKLERFSVQEMIDCAGNNNKGCDGGDVCSLLDWMKSNNIKLHKEGEYSGDSFHKCKMNMSLPGVQIEKIACENFVGSEDIILDLLARNGPVAVAINAQTWQNYIGGIIQFHCSGKPSQLNHAVVLVGYDLMAPIPYYIARNTWGKDFGDNGYLYLAINENICGLANEVSALTVL